MHFYLFCGIPGVGKTVLSRNLAHKIKENGGNVRLYERDAIRCALLNGPKHPFDKGELYIPLNFLCKTKIITALHRGNIVIYDACNTHLGQLYLLLAELRKEFADELTITMIWLGSACSESKHEEVDVEPTLYSEYTRDCEGNLYPDHNSVPKEIMQEKREGMITLTEEYKKISHMISKRLQFPPCPPIDSTVDFILKQ